MNSCLLSVIVLTLFQGNATDSGQRLPDWEKCFDAASKKPWGTTIRPIPATVIDVGILRFVPYKSFRAGTYELNVYGNPQRPACVEIGVHKELTDSKEAKSNCLALMLQVLPHGADRELLRRLNLEKDLQKREGLVFEITPPTADDSFGGWWISIYSETELDQSRASEKELARITVSKKDIESGRSSPAASTSSNAADANSSETAAKADWKPEDLAYARPTSAKSSGSKSVYVHSYTRKDGTYVQSHTRSAPSSRK